jgi:hypothetical protein
MTILYKYCDHGIEQILSTLELKLPYISQVNDPLECLPFLYCPEDLSALKEECLRAFKRKGIRPPDNWKKTLTEQAEVCEIYQKLESGVGDAIRDMNQKSCLLSVSKTAQNTVMWAHYAEKHKGAVVGIDFDNVFPGTGKERGILLHAVNYCEDRPRMDVFSEYDPKELEKILSTKSVDWSYEQEFRTVFSFDYLQQLQQKKLAYLKNFDGNDSWFLPLNPASIREVIFGLYTDSDLKSKIGKLVECQHLQHVKLLQTEESDTYALNLADSTTSE